eukprot:GHUV01050116.1.p1 GENE.GHUV01050116.1~~GHUV01050116.1.p1  ORF type:complete len:116 (-),score=13.52 GHUV01050116.1:269-616(-)
MLASIARGTLQAPLQQAYASLLTGLRSFASEPATDHDKQLPQMPPFDYKPVPYTGPSKEEVIALRKKFLSPGAVLVSANCCFCCSSCSHMVYQGVIVFPGVSSHMQLCSGTSESL